MSPDDWRTRYAPPWARTVLQVLETSFPYAAGHVSLGAADTDAGPARLHPAFHGALDWHSSVHMQWSAVRLLTVAGDRLDADLRARLTGLLDERLTAANGRAEVDYLRERPSYERPYGWAWAAMLAAAVRSCPLPQSAGWAAATAPLADVVADLLVAWMPGLGHPVRHGVHANTAFAAGLAHEAYRSLGRADVVEAVEGHARRWFGTDRDYPTRWEPSGHDFLSPALCEADLMRRILPAEELPGWLDRFLPALGEEGDPLLAVPAVGDRTDGQLVHLYGLGLSRAWQLRLLAPYLPADRRERVRRAAGAQVAAVEQEIVTGDFMATHWLVSFALLAVTAGE